MPLNSNYKLFRRIVLSATVAGVLSGSLMTIVQMTTMVPLIAQAEVYEAQTQANGGTHAVPEPHAHYIAQNAPYEGDSAEEPPEGMRRVVYTTIATLLVAVAYGLLIGAGLGTLKRTGWRQGLTLGLAGFIVFQLAPSLGQPPLLPGVPSAALGPRQLWWVGAVLATALSLVLVYCAYTRSGKPYWWGRAHYSPHYPMCLAHRHLKQVTALCRQPWCTIS